jgi:hypothetical protein
MTRRRAGMCGIGFMLLLLNGCQHASPPEAPRWTTGPLHWGEPVNGLQAGLARRVMVLPPGSSRSRSDAPAHVEFHLQNVSDEPIRLIEPVISCQGRSPGRPLVDASFVTADGDAYRAGYLSASPDVLVKIVELAPGESRSVLGQFGGELRLGPYVWGLGSPVEGQCRLSYHNRQPSVVSLGGPNLDHTETHSGLWTGDVETAAMTIRFDDESETRLDH